MGAARAEGLQLGGRRRSKGLQGRSQPSAAPRAAAPNQPSAPPPRGKKRKCIWMEKVPARGARLSPEPRPFKSRLLRDQASRLQPFSSTTHPWRPQPPGPGRTPAPRPAPASLPSLPRGSPAPPGFRLRPRRPPAPRAPRRRKLPASLPSGR